MGEQTWTLWEDDRDGSNLLIQGTVLPPHEQGRLLATFRAADHIDAARQRNEFMGWEPYKPMPEPVLNAAGERIGPAREVRGG